MAQTTVSSTSVSSAGETVANYRRPLAMVTTLFFMWGFLTSLNDILIPHFKNVFGLDYKHAFLIQLVFFTSYFLFSLPSGKLIDAVGYKKAMVAGLFTMGIGAILFLPAASAPSYPLFLAALIVLAAGMTILQVSANPYVAILGPQKTASSRLNFAQAFTSLGTIIGPVLGGLLILSNAPKTTEEIRAMSDTTRVAFRLNEASSVKVPYLGLALCLFLLGIVIWKFRLPAFAAASGKANASASQTSLWRHSRL